MINTTNESLLLLGILSGVLGIVLYVWTALALAGLFRKAGEETWQAWVPLVNIAVVLKLGGFSPWLVLLSLIPGPGTIAVWVLVVIAAHRIGRGFAAGPGMTVLAALLFVVWASILGLGPATWRAPRRDAPQPPWAFAPPMSDFTPLLEHRMGGTATGGEFAQHAATEFSATRLSSAPPSAPSSTSSSAPDAPTGAPVADAGDGTHLVRRDLSPAEFEPSPWAPPEPARPAAPAQQAPAAGTSSSRANDAPAAVAPTEPVSVAAPSIAADAAGDAVAQPNDVAASADATPPAAPSSDAAPPAADVAPQPVGGSTPAAALRPPAAPAREDDDGWASEIDDVSAISPSPFFPPSAASTRPGVVPSLADADDQAPRPATRRTWDAVPASGRRSFASAPDEFPELSEEVSAVMGAPAAGAPRTANAAVPAQQRRAEADRDADGLDDDLDAADHTVVVARRRASWQLVTADGVIVPLTSDVVVVGRQPAADPAHPRAQLVGIDDSTRTVSKTHARLELRSDVWHITDLQSTNGVVLITFLGAEIELEPGSNAPAGDRFLLGDAELRLERPGS